MSHSTPPDGESKPTSTLPDSKGLNVARFRPSQQKPAQLSMRCAVYSEVCAEQRRQQTPSHRTVRELTNDKYGENSNCYWCLARDRSGTRRSILEARLQRRRKLATHYQGKSLRSVFESCPGQWRHRRSKHR